MTCDQHQERIFNYERLTAGEQQSVDAHIRVCPQCREVARAWRALDTTLAQQVHAPALPANFDAQLRERIVNEPTTASQTGLAEKRRALEAEYVASRRRHNLRRGIPHLLDVLGYGVAGGIGGWIVAALLSRASASWTASLTLTGPQMLVASSAVGLIIALGLAALAFSRPWRQSLLR